MLDLVYENPIPLTPKQLDIEIERGDLFLVARALAYNVPWADAAKRKLRPVKNTREVVKNLVALYRGTKDKRYWVDALAYCVLSLDWVSQFVSTCVLLDIDIKLDCMRILSGRGDFKANMLQVGGILLNRVSKDDIKANGCRNSKTEFRIGIMESILNNEYAEAGAKIVAALEQHA